MQETQEMYVWSPSREDALGEKMTTHSRILAWRIPWAEDPGRLQSMGSQRVGHNWATNTQHKETLLPLIILNSMHKVRYGSSLPPSRRLPGCPTFSACYHTPRKHLMVRKKERIKGDVCHVCWFCLSNKMPLSLREGYDMCLIPWICLV